MLKPYLLETFDVKVVLASPSFPNISGNDSFVLSTCLTPKGLLKKRKSLPYPFLASGVRPNREKNTNAQKGLTHSSQFSEYTFHRTIDHMLFGNNVGSQSE